VPTQDAEKELEQWVSQTIPLGRFSEADEVAKAVLYLASDDSAILTGTEIVVDGGATGAPLRMEHLSSGADERLRVNPNAFCPEVKSSLKETHHGRSTWRQGRRYHWWRNGHRLGDGQEIRRRKRLCLHFWPAQG